MHDLDHSLVAFVVPKCRKTPVIHKVSGYGSSSDIIRGGQRDRSRRLDKRS
jgi:hypothetical protein